MEELFKSNGFWALVGAIAPGLGFLVYAWWRICKLKGLISDELCSNVRVIDFKLETIESYLSALDSGKIRKGMTLPIIKTAYVKHMPEVYHHYSKKERNNLYLIYEKLAVVDNDFNKVILNCKNKAAQNAPGLRDDLKVDKNNFEEIKKWIEGFLNGELEDLLAPKKHVTV